MNLQTLWEYVQEKGIQLTEKDGELVIHAPQGTMNAELLAQLKAHKPQLLLALQSGRFAGTLSQSSQQLASVNKITPDMLPLVSLSQDEIDLIVGNMTGGLANIQDIYPLAPLQEGIFFHHLLDDKQGDTYLLRSVIRFSERNSLDEFLCGLQKVIDRHDILRTSIHWLGLPQPVQVVHRVAKLTVEELVFTSSNDALGQLLDYTDPRHITLDVQSAPLIKAVIAVDQSSGAWLLSLLNHHLVCDHMTLDGIVAEIRQMSAGQGDKLPPPVPYRNFIAQALAVPTAEHEAYFKTQLQDIDAPTAPFDILDTQVNSGQITEATLVLADGLAQAIRQSAQLHGVATAVLFHVAWAQVLARLTNREEVVFGTVLLGRLQGVDGAGQVLGLLINTLPIRISLSHRSVQEVVKTTYRQLGELLKHEQAPLSLAQRCSQVAPPLPLFTTLFNYRHNPQQAKHPDALNGLCVYQSEERTNYPIAISVNDLGQGFSLTAQCIDAVDPARIISYLNHAMTELTDALAKAPDYPMSGLDMLPESERRQLLYSFNATASDYPQNCCIQQLFEQQVQQTPDAPALVYQDQVLSYSQLNGYANQAAHRLLNLGIRPDDRVAICMERSLEMIVALLGILKAGGAYVPLEPGYPKERLAYMLADSKPIAVFTQQEGQGNLPTQAELELPILFIDLLGGQSQGMPGQYPNPSLISLNSQQLAYIIYTSGSTGYPKGVMVEQGSVINLWTGLENTAFRDFPKNSRMGLNAALVFDASVQAIVQLLSGRCVVIIPGEIRADIPAFLAFIEKEKINALDCTPSQLELMLSAGLLDKTNHCLEKVLVGGEAIGNATWCLLKNATAIDFYNVYGPTECTVDATIAHVNTAGDKPQIGSPLANTQCYILDAYLRPVPIGVTGEIYIGGAGAARGYLNRPGLTAGRFIPNPFRQAGDGQPPRLYQTGDLGRWLPDGTIDYLGRNDFQVKLRGFRIELGEIEAQLRRCPGVREAAVLARDDTRDDRTGNLRLVAYLVPDPGHAPDPADLRARLAAQLADHMLPAAYVTLERFPLTANGKLDRQALPEPDAGSTASRAYQAPQGATETAIAQIWQELLHIAQVGRHDHFFELGGHSLLAVQFVARLRQALGIELPLRTLFDHPVLAALAEAAAPAARSALPPVTPCDRSQPIPLSWAQQRLWFIARLDPAASQAYHIALGLRLQGELDRTALQAALDRLVARHEALRTTFLADGGEPRQHIAPAASGFQLATHDLATPAPADQAAAIARHTRAEADAPFDLENGPLIRGRLLRLGEREHLLLVTQHHIIADGWSLGRLTAEFAALYRAFSQGQPDPLPPLALQYPDYAVWQRHWLQGGVLDSQLHYWRSQLDGSPGLLEMPTDRPRPAQQSHRGGSVAFSLPAALSDSLRHYSHRHGATLFMTLLTAWAILLSRLGGQTDLVIGTPVANRPHADLEALIGLFVNTLPLRVRLDGDPSGAALLAQVKATTLDAYSHPDLPFGQLVEALNPPRRLSHNPVVQVLLSLDNTPRQDPDLPGLSLSVLDGGNPTSQFDLSLSFTDPGDTLSGHLHYASDLYDPATIARFIGHYQTLLHNLTEGDSRPVSQLGLLTDYERQQLLQGGNASPASYPAQPCLHQRFEAHAASAPNAIALSYQGQTLSYGGLNRLANRLAHGLIAHGIRPDQRVALCAERSPDMVIGLLAIHKAGGAYLPLDPGYPDERLAYLLADSRPVAMVTQTALQPRLAALSPTPLPTLILDAPVADPAHQRNGQPQDQAGNPAGQGNPDSNPDPGTLGLTPGHLAYVIHTSGSTGQPKGVMVSHANAARLFAATDPLFRFNAGDTWTLFHAIAFDFSVWELWGALAYGGRLVIVPQATARNPQAFYRLLCEERVTVLNQTPGAFRQLIAAQSQAQDPAATHSLRTVIFGGEALDFASLRPWLQANPLAQTQLVNMYGITETTVHATFRSLNEADIRHGTASNIGQPLGDLSLYLLDPHHQPVPVGVTGEIYLGGAGVARGYLDRPGLTAGRFIPNPFRQAGDGQPPRLYQTGDLGRWRPDGTIDYLGRNDFQVKLRGFRIELGEIEAQLRRCPGVREAAVLARDDGAGNPRLVAYLVPEPGHTLEPAGLRTRLAEHLAEHMLPAAYVTLERFPLTANGKLDRQALPEPDGDSLAKRAYQAPQGATETAIARIWQELLHIAQVGRHDQFFELGGHSLLVVQLVARLREVLGVELALHEVFVHPTLLALAQCAEQAQASILPPIPMVDRSLALPLSWAQQRLWFLIEFNPEASKAYHLPIALRLQGRLHKTLLRKTLNQLVARHEVLRTAFAMIDGELRQVIADPAIGFVLTEQDLRDLPKAEQEVALEKIADTESSEAFDLAHGPLIRGQLLQLDQDGHVLLITQHHIISDGWSLAIIVNEVSALYSAYRLGLPDPLPELRIQYADYAVWQRQWLQGDALQAQIGFWREKLNHAPAFLKLPTDRPRPVVQRYQGDVINFNLSASLTDGLKQFAQEQGCTLFMVLLAAWSVSLARLSGQADMVMGSPVANRQCLELEPLIGFFVNTLALRVRLENDPNVLDLLAQIKATTLAAYQHQDVPFEQIVEAVHPIRDTSYSPIFQHVLVMADTPNTQAVSLPGLSLSTMETKTTTAQHDTSLYLQDAGEAIIGNLVFATALFDRKTAQAMVGGFMAVLEKFAANPGLHVSDLLIGHEITLPMLLPNAFTNAPIPLSYHQERLWFIDAFEAGYLYPASPVYHNIPLLLQLDGEWSTASLAAALNQIIARHKALRTRIHSDGENVWQEILTVPTPISLDEITVSEEGLLAQAIAETRKPFALNGGELFRAILLRSDSQHAMLTVTIHHIIVDRTSMRLLADELLDIYIAGQENRAPVLPELSVHYQDYVNWQRQLSDAVQLAYWRYQLRGRLQAMELPMNRPRPLVHTFTEARYEFVMDALLVLRLKNLAAQQGDSHFAYLFAGFNALLRRYSGHDELVIGTSAPCRNHAMLNPVIGPIANLLVLRNFCDGQTTFADLLKQIQRTTQQAHACQEMPFDQLVLALNPEKDMGRTALFDILFQFDGQAGKTWGTGKLNARMIETNLGYGKNDLHLLIHPEQDTWVGKLVYNADFFDPDLIQQMFRHYLVLLDALTNDTNQLVDEVPLLAAAEIQQQLEDWNTTQADYPKHKTLHQLIEGQVVRTPERIAVNLGGNCLSYAELNVRANQLAHYLTAQGVDKEAIVALCLDRGLDMIVAILAVLKAGGAYLPIDPNYPAARIQYMLADSGACQLITTQAWAETLALTGNAVLLDADHALIASYSNSNPDKTSSPEQLAYVIYTSGSTGEPKGVLLEHRHVVRLLINSRMPFVFSENDVWSLFHSYAFDFSVWEIFGALLYGGRITIVPEPVRKDPALFMTFLCQEQVTILNQTPSAFYNLSNAIFSHPALPVLALRYVIFGGENLDPANLQHFHTAYPAVSLVNMYGITETCVHVTYKQVTDTDIRQNASNIGLPIPTTTVYVLDAKQHLLPIGVPGEIYVGGLGVARGYLNREKLTQERFINNPYQADERLYRSGDLAKRLVNGELVYLGRMDDQIQLRGFRIELGEIEARLCACDGVSEAVVIAREDSPGDKRLVAYLIAETGYQPDLAALHRQLAVHLAEYMLPSAFVLLDRFPLTSNGKLDRQALPAPDDAAAISRPYEAPQNTHEMLLAGIWRGLLHLERIGRHDNFFELGGHSLLAVQLVNRIQEAFHVRVALLAIFENPTLITLADYLMALQIAQYSESDVALLEKELDGLSEAELKLLLSEEAN